MVAPVPGVPMVASGAAMRPTVDLSGFAPRATLVVTLMAAVLVFRLHEVYPPLSAVRPALTFTAVGVLYLLARTRPSVFGELLSDPVFRLVTLLLVWAACTVPTSIWKGGSITAWQSLMLNTVLVGATLCVPPTETAYRVLRNAYLAFAAVLGIALFTIGQMVAEDRYSVSYSLDPNDLASVFAMCVPFALAITFSKAATTTQRLATLAITGLLIAGVTRTGSRGGTLAVLGALATLFMYLPSRRKAVLAATIIPILVGGFLLGPQSYRDKILGLAAGEEDYNQTTYGGRIQVWKRGMGYVASNPVLGLGVGNFTTQEGEVMKESGIGGHWMTAHNTYVQAAAELGIPGFVLLLTLMGTALRLAHRTARSSLEDAAPVAGMIGFMVAAFFLSHAYAYHFYGLLALVGLRSRVSMSSSAVAPVMVPTAIRR
jgi:O-antigen ligase